MGRPVGFEAAHAATKPCPPQTATTKMGDERFTGKLNASHTSCGPHQDDVPSMWQQNQLAKGLPGSEIGQFHQFY